MNRNKNKINSLLILLCMLLVNVFLLSGCKTETNETELNNNKTNFQLIIKDSLDRSVKIEKKPQRIISLAPSATEILFALGLGDKVFGVTKYCDYPPEAKTKEVIGGFSDPNMEKILSLNPDLVLATTMHEKAVKDLESVDIPVIVLDAKTIEGVMENITLVGKATGHEKEANEVVASMKEKVQKVVEKVKDIPEEDKPTVYYEVFSEPIMTAGPKTIIHDLITQAGGINIGADAETDYVEYSVEVLLRKNPEVMIAPDLHGSNTATLENVKKRPGWADISAVKNGKVYILEDDLITLPGPRIVEGLEAIAKVLHPERF
ncbi:MAG: cobalamin transport system substrate-binding protein [Clostridia bacterium]|nr:cobalamin transport system substrate-binding protein [Clostridia bacterium]